jgi:hypothetical protein
MQPARLYYRIAAGRRAAVVRILGEIKCVQRAPSSLPRWGWWHVKEAARLDFSRFADTAQPSPDPVVLGIVDMRGPEEMEITVRSLHRALLAARFFGRRLRHVSLVRVRVLDRLLTEDDLCDGVDAVDDLLDGEVTAIDPRDAEARWEAAVSRRGPDGVRSVEHWIPRTRRPRTVTSVRCWSSALCARSPIGWGGPTSRRAASFAISRRRSRTGQWAPARRADAIRAAC